jgi:hypothetical protein
MTQEKEEHGDIATNSFSSLRNHEKIRQLRAEPIVASQQHEMAHEKIESKPQIGDSTTFHKVILHREQLLMSVYVKKCILFSQADLASRAFIEFSLVNFDHLHDPRCTWIVVWIHSAILLLLHEISVQKTIWTYVIQVLNGGDITKKS